MKIGILALQGDFIEHEVMLQRLGVEVVEVRLPRDLTALDGIIIPGGESTTFAKIANRAGLVVPLRQYIMQGLPTWGTCAGLIFLANDVGRDQVTLAVMDITVQRNAFGRQVDSFTTDLLMAGLPDGAFPGVFIRAPIITRIGSEVEGLCTLENGQIVAARQRHILATSFHPELTEDTRVHSYFLDYCRKQSVVHNQMEILNK